MREEWRGKDRKSKVMTRKGWSRTGLRDRKDSSLEVQGENEKSRREKSGRE